MEIGLIDVDGHNFPNLALMKISAYEKKQNNHVEWWNGLKHYDRVYQAKVFDDTYTQDNMFCIMADQIIKGGTGYGLDNVLVEGIEHLYPDYSLYQKYTKETAYGFLTRGCPRGCGFCIVSKKEGSVSRRVADLSEFWKGQREIKLLDPNLLACKEREILLRQLGESGAYVDFTQGLDIRLVTKDSIRLLNQIRTKSLHFAWDNPKEDLTHYFAMFNELTRIKDHRLKGVYVLTNYNSTLEEDLYRIYTLRDLGYDPYVMVYDKPHAPRVTRYLQRWCNNKIVFNAEPDFKKFNPRIA